MRCEGRARPRLAHTREDAHAPIRRTPRPRQCRAARRRHHLRRLHRRPRLRPALADAAARRGRARARILRSLPLPHPSLLAVADAARRQAGTEGERGREDVRRQAAVHRQRDQRGALACRQHPLDGAGRRARGLLVPRVGLLVLRGVLGLHPLVPLAAAAVSRGRPPAGRIRVGIGGWNYAPWRGSFYPPGLAQRRELEYAAQRLGSIEINGTYYGSQKPESFGRWRDETPGGFVVAVKAPRYATNRRSLAGAGPTIERFFASGVMELGDKLGPINWQFLPTKVFEPDDFAAFLGLLPHSLDGRALRHAVEVRHESFRSPEFVELARSH